MLDKTNLKTFFAINCAVMAAGATFGLSMPLITIVLKSWGESESVIGANAAMPGVAAVIFSFYFPRLLQWLGFMRFLYLAVTGTIISLILFPLIPNTIVWFFIRFMFGASQISIFVLSEMWISHISSEQSRGKLTAIYTIFFSIGFLTGAALVGWVGTEGWTPFLCGVGLISLTSIPFLFIRNNTPKIETHAPLGLKYFFSNTPHIAFAMVLTGIIYIGSIALAPAYALQKGLDTVTASNTVVWIGTGSLFMPFFIGHLADKVSRIAVLYSMTVVTVAALWVFPLTFDTTYLRILNLLLVGGLANSYYAICLTLTGQTYKHAQLAGAIASMTVCFSIGELLGPTISGIAMDIYLDGFSMSLALLATLYLLYLTVNRKPAQEQK